MPIPGFDYNAFAQNLTQQAIELVPQDFNDAQRNYVANTLLNFSTVAGQALSDDTEHNFNADQAVMITQIIAEWSFHKSVDLIRSGIPQQYWDSIMQKIAFTIFEIAKQAFSQNMPQDQILQLIEHHVKKTYIECVEELKTKNLISEELSEQAEKQSNIDAMMQQAAEQGQLPEAAQPDIPQQGGDAVMPVQNVQSGAVQPAMPSGQAYKTFKLATLGLLFQRVKQDKVQSILDKFNADDANSVIKYMEIPDLQDKVDPNITMKCLQEIKTNLPGGKVSVTPAMILEKIQNVAQCIEKQRLEQILQLERPNVKRFVFSAIEGEYNEDIPPEVGNVIASYLANSVQYN